MKFKIASILEFVIPLSVAGLMLSAFSGCGGGGDHGSGKRVYDGEWTLKFWTETLYPVGASAPGGVVSCNDAGLPWVPLTITHGYGKTTWYSDCTGVPSYGDPTGASGSSWTWVITIDINVSGVVAASVNGNQSGEGTCQDLYTCSATIAGTAPIGMMRPAF